MVEPDLRLLEWHLPPSNGDLALHRRRFARQESGEAVYLVAWYDQQPIGHVYLTWTSPSALPDPRGCPRLDDLLVSAAFRRRGVGSQLLAAAEGLAGRHGDRQVGLVVARANRPARALFRARGYQAGGLDLAFDRQRQLYLVKLNVSPGDNGIGRGA